jgi:hypothetical protein
LRTATKVKAKMRWTAVPFGKYAGKTLPEIIVRDPDWFFWALPKLYGKLGDQAQDLARKVRAIKIPKSQARKWRVEYRYEFDHRFRGFTFVKDSVPYRRWVTRLAHLDLALPLRRKKYDKRAGRIVVRDFRRYFFGERKRLTKRRCEAFFSDDANFIGM